MTNPSILAFAGEKSQTGLAVKEEFPGVAIVGSNETFEEIATMVQKHAILTVLPMWNSHRGEIRESQVIDLLFEKKARLYRIWPKQIEFECLKKTDGKISTIVSVMVAVDQCSKFIAQLGAAFIEERNTCIAYERFKVDTGIDAVLRVPLEEKEAYLVETLDASNPLNFTTFVLLGGDKVTGWKKSKWGDLYNILKGGDGLYYGVQMPIRTFVVSDDQAEFLEALMGQSKSVEETPKVLFVSERSPGVCGLLIEANHETDIHDILSDEGLSSEIMVITDIGETTSPYPTRTKDLIGHLSLDYDAHDFIRHKGTKTCFYACPPLDLVTHGYDEKIIEPVVRGILNKYFELYTTGVFSNCTRSQTAFFEKHKKSYLLHGKDFIEFVDIGL